jgi:hypothetical protein
MQGEFVTQIQLNKSFENGAKFRLMEMGLITRNYLQLEKLNAKKMLMTNEFRNILFSLLLFKK